MKNLIKTDFDLILEELNKLDENYDATADFNIHVNLKTPTAKEIMDAQDAFKDNAKKLILDYPNFHLGYDLMMFEELYKFYLNNSSSSNTPNNSAYADDHARQVMNGMFKDNGQWQHKGTYTYIKNIIAYTGNRDLEKAMKLAWGLAYTSDSAKLATSVITMTGSVISSSTNVANNAKQRAIDFIKKAVNKAVVYSFAGSSSYNDTISFDNASFEEKLLTYLCLQLCTEQKIKTIPMAIRNVAITPEQRTLFIRGLQKVRDIIYSKDITRVLEISRILSEVQGELEKGGPFYTDWFQIFYNNKKIFVDFRVMEMGLALYMKKIGWHITYGELVDIIGLNNIEEHFKYGDSFLTLLYRVKILEDN